MHEGNGMVALKMLQKDIECHLEEAHEMPLEFKDCPSIEGRDFHKWMHGSTVILLRSKQVEIEQTIKALEEAKKTKAGVVASPADEPCSEFTIGKLFRWKVRGAEATALVAKATTWIVALGTIAYIAYKVDKLDLGQIHALSVGKANMEILEKATGITPSTNELTSTRGIP